MTSLTCFSDADAFGGHEAMAVAAARQLASRHEMALDFVYYRGNQRLRATLDALVTDGLPVRPIATSVRVKTLNFLQSPWHRREIAMLADLFNGLPGRAVLLLQGRIENGTVGALAARRAGKRVLSYLPMAHNCQEMGRAGFLGLRDFLVNREYARVDGFITIGDSVRRQIQRACPGVPVEVAANPLPAGGRVLSREEARTELGIIEDGQRHIAVIGRIDFRQKAQDLLLNIAAAGTAQGRPWVFHLYGEGPDEGHVRQAIHSRGLQAAVQCHGYLKGGPRLLAAFDMVTIPSRFEGVPLIMLEALHAGVPVTGSDRDGMQDWLPPAWRYKPEDAGSAVACMSNVLDQWPSAQRQAAELAMQIPNEEQFGNEFARALRSLM